MHPMFPRLRRNLFHAATAASTLLLLAILLLWPRSHFHHDTLRYNPDDGWDYGPNSWTAEIRSWAGRLELRASSPGDFDRSYGGYGLLRLWALEGVEGWSYTDRSTYSTAPDESSACKLLGCEFWVANPGSIRHPAYRLYIPCLYLALLSALLPAVWLVRANQDRRQEHRLTHNLCPTCAYDLRAHKPGGQCPECGTLIPAAQVKEPIR